MKLAVLGPVIVGGLITSPVFGACEMPTLVAAIPDGATADEPALLAAQARVRAYIEAMDEYIACENEELTASGNDATSEYLFQMSSRIEAARDEVDAVATRFNDQVEAFRAARPEPAVPPQLPFAPATRPEPAPGGVQAPR